MLNVINLCQCLLLTNVWLDLKSMKTNVITVIYDVQLRPLTIIMNKKHKTSMNSYVKIKSEAKAWGLN